MSVLEGLQPVSVFRFFEDISKIPRGTFDTKKISDFCVAFAKERNLEVIQDEVNNIIIKKPGTAGYEACDPVIIQGHLDMVCEKTMDSQHDFKTDGIELVVKDGFISAKDTTLGADDGIAIAYALAILDSEDIPHPPIEALFTVDEEVGMEGATAIDMSQIKGEFLLNIDSDVEGTILAGCAGGFRKTFSFSVEREMKQGEVIRIQIDGLRGGHSGAEIDQQRGNANKMMGRLLNRLNQKTEIRLIDINGGTKDNVITSGCTANIVCEDSSESKKMLDEMLTIWKEEFREDEPALDLKYEIQTNQTNCLKKADSDKMIFFLNCSPYGVQEFSRSLKGLVETSLNMGVVKTEESEITVMFLVRSSSDKKLEQMQETLDAWGRQFNAKTKVSGAYPAWVYRPDSKLRKIASDTYQELFGVTPEVTTLHAGLECGLLSGKKPELDCISFGPITYDIHSVHERLDIASTERMWEFLKALLANCK